MDRRRLFKPFLIAIATISLAIGSAVPAWAATDVLVSGPSNVKTGQTFQVVMSLRGAADVDTVRLNGSYSADLLEWVAASPSGVFQIVSPGTSVNTANGTFSFGTFSLSATASGAARVAVLTFRAKKPGTATIQLNTTSHVISAGEEQIGVPGRLTVTIGGEAPPLPPGTKITITSSSHPDPNAWYRDPNVSVSWKITGNTVKQVFVGFDQTPDGPADTVSADSAATFIASSDGIWYAHLRVVFADGTTRREDFRIRIDRTPPRPISPIVEQTSVGANVPNSVWFGTTDAESGISRYDVYVDGRFVTSTRNQSYPLADESSGTHKIAVMAYDYAGNSSEGTTSFSILPGLFQLLSPAVVNALQSFFQTVGIVGAVLFGIGALFFFIAWRRKKKTDS